MHDKHSMRTVAKVKASYTNSSHKQDFGVFFFLDEAHESALHMCVQRNDKQFTELLIKANADLNIRDNEGKRPVDLPIQSEEVIHILKGAMFEKERVRIAK